MALDKNKNAAGTGEIAIKPWQQKVEKVDSASSFHSDGNDVRHDGRMERKMRPVPQY
jgi:hypothetical protein